MLSFVVLTNPTGTEFDYLDLHITNTGHKHPFSELCTERSPSRFLRLNVTDEFIGKDLTDKHELFLSESQPLARWFPVCAAGI